MTLRAAIIFIALSCTTMLCTARWNEVRQKSPAPSRSQPSGATDADVASGNQAQDESPNSQAQNDQNQALRSDLVKMKVLVQQMETNLAFVDTTQSPLKHQFQLEIDMWRMTIAQMERRLQPRSRADQVK